MNLHHAGNAPTHFSDFLSNRILEQHNLQREFIMNQLRTQISLEK